MKLKLNQFMEKKSLRSIDEWLPMSLTTNTYVDFVNEEAYELEIGAPIDLSLYQIEQEFLTFLTGNR